MGLFIPIAAAIAAAGAAFELLKSKDEDKKPAPAPAKPQTQPGKPPPGATDQPALPGSGVIQPAAYVTPISPSLPNAPTNPMVPQPAQPSKPAAPPPVILVPPVQPQPTDPSQQQPPLPPAPASGIQTQYAIVATNGPVGVNESRLRVRGTPSTTGPVVPGGEPASGGGIPKGATVMVTGPTEEQMTPIKYQALTGWVYSGYLKQIGPASTAIAVASATDETFQP